MIETPLFGRFQGENKRLVFSAPTPYHVLVKGCVITGGCMIAFGFLEGLLNIDGPLYPAWWTDIGAMVLLAGIAAAFSLTSISFDLKERHYRRRHGPGLFTKMRHGSVNEIDALVLIAEPNPRMLAGGVTYHLVLHWKGNSQPLMVVQQDTRILPPGQLLNFGAQQLLAAGLQYAQAIGIPFYDNSHFASKCPMPIWR